MGMGRGETKDGSRLLPVLAPDFSWEATERCVNGCFSTMKSPVRDKKLIFFENLKRLDVQNDLYAKGRVGFRKAMPAFLPAF